MITERSGASAVVDVGSPVGESGSEVAECADPGYVDEGVLAATAVSQPGAREIRREVWASRRVVSNSGSHCVEWA